MARKGKRLHLYIPDEMHEKLKIVAHKSYCTMTTYVIRAIVEQVGRDFGEKEFLKFIKPKD